MEKQELGGAVVVTILTKISVDLHVLHPGKMYGKAGSRAWKGGAGALGKAAAVATLTKKSLSAPGARW